MKHAKLSGFALAAALSVVLIGSQLSSVTSAASKPKSQLPDNNGANGMMISPLRTDLTIKPGKSKTIEINITNLTHGRLNLEPIENDFVAGNEEGHPALILNKDSYAQTHSLKKFMIPIKQFSLASGKTKTVKLRINVPPNAQAGGYFGALRFLPTSETDKPVSLDSSVASLVLLTVPGDTTHKLSLTNFEVQQSDDSAGIFGTFSHPDHLRLFVRFQNGGNAQEAPFGQINVAKGKDVVYSYNFNQKEPRDEILPDSARRWYVPLKNISNFGHYTVSGTFTYGEGQSIQIDQSFWVIPTLYFIIGAAVIVFIILVIIFTRLFLKGYKRRVLRGSRRR